jgi:hypothetical protein
MGNLLYRLCVNAPTRPKPASFQQASGLFSYPVNKLLRRHRRFHVHQVLQFLNYVPDRPLQTVPVIVERDWLQQTLSGRLGLLNVLRESSSFSGIP